MKKLVLLALVLLALGATVVPVLAQEGEGGQGGIIVDSTFGSSNAETLNPILCSDTACSRIVGLLYPGLLGVDPESGTIQAGAAGGLTESMEVSEDNLVYTFHLRDDYVWSDGTPVTSADIMYYWNAVQDPAVASPLQSNYLTVESVEAPDAQTIVVTFTSPDCTALTTAATLTAVPSHILPAEMGEALVNSDFNLNPSVTGGVFQFGAYTPEQVSLVANPLYPASDTELGFVNPTGYIYRLVGDQTIQVQQFLDGELALLDTPAVSFRADIRAAADAGEVQAYDWSGNAWDYLALNFADPSAPASAFDETGAALDQGNHPMFADTRVRQAIAQGINVDEIIERAVFGEGTRMPSSQLPSSPVFDTELEPWAYDPEAAAALLEEAGWVDDDNDPSTPRVAQGAMYAEDGTPFEFTLYTNQGNTRREAIGLVVQENLAQLGIQVNFEAIDFNVLVDMLDQQTFDAVILGWRNGFPDDPDQTSLFTTAADVAPGGNNNVSYSNERVDELMAEALNMPGCAMEDRAPIYQEIQQILRDDLPYIWLFSQGGFYAARAEVENFGPLPAQMYWNIDAWAYQP